MSRNCIPEKYGDKYPASPLNFDSTHPNPYRNLNEVEAHIGVWDGGYRIYKGNPTKIEPVPNFASDGALSERLWFGFRMGLKIGLPLAFIDAVAIRKVKTPLAIAARLAYVIVPTCAMGMSYFVARDILGNFNKFRGGDKNATWTYAAAPALGPASIVAVWIGWRTAYSTTVFGGLASLMYKKSCDWGHDPWDEQKRWNSRVYQAVFPADAPKWKGLAWYDEKDPGPAWKKFDEQDQAKKAAH